MTTIAQRELGARPWRSAAALLTVYLVWGSTYLAIAVMVDSVPPLFGAGARFLLAGLLLCAICAARGGIGRLRVSRRELGAAALAGNLILFGGIGLLTVAEQHVPSGLAALLIASVPLWLVLLRRAAGERVGWPTVACVAAGFAGIALLFAPGDSATAPAGWLAVLLVAAALTALGAFLSPRLPLPSEALVATAFETLTAGAAMVVVAVVAGELGSLRPGEIEGDSLAAFAYLVVAGSVLAYTAFVWLLDNVPVSIVGTYAYVNPVVAVALGAAVLGEVVTGRVVVAAVAVLVSVALLIWRTGAQTAH